MQRDWTKHFGEVTPIRQLGSFHLYRGRWRDRPCVVAASASNVDPETAEERALAAVAAHADVHHPAVPAVVTHGREGDTAYVAFDTHAVHDLGRLITVAADRVPNAGEIAAYIELIIQVLLALPADRSIYRVGVANVLVDDSGRAVFLGLGCNLLAQQGPALPAVSVVPGAPRRQLVRALLRALQHGLGAGAWWPAVGRAELLPPERELDLFLAALRDGWQLDGLRPDPDAGSAWLAAAVARQPATVEAGARIIDRFRIQSQLGFTASGTLYLARDEVLGEPVVLRGLPGHDPRGPRLSREARLLRRLRHPNVVGGFDLLVKPDALWVVMAYVPGESLTARMTQRRSALRLAQDLTGIADALAALAERGIVHRSVGPDSILFDPDRGAVLVDFGLARDVELETADAQITATGEVVGTFRYLAPELVLGEGDLTPAVDVYAFGIVLLEVFAGRSCPMHPGPDGARRLLAPTEAPAALAEAIATALDPDPAARPTAQALRAVLISPTAHRLSLSDDGREAALDGRAIPFGRRRAHPRILRALAARRAAGQDEPMEIDALFSAGWPGERLPDASLRNRVYVTLNSMRELGLGAVLETVGGGYRLAPTVEITWR